MLLLLCSCPAPSLDRTARREGACKRPGQEFDSNGNFKYEQEIFDIFLSRGVENLGLGDTSSSTDSLSEDKGRQSRRSRRSKSRSREEDDSGPRFMGLQVWPLIYQITSQMQVSRPEVRGATNPGLQPQVRSRRSLD